VTFDTIQENKKKKKKEKGGRGKGFFYLFGI
jgi:hypothetical protein